MQPSIKRRTFLQLLALPALAALWPRTAQAQTQSGLVYTDSEGHAEFVSLFDGNLNTGIEYQP